MHVDRERVGITWATFGHLYMDYYVFQYATGISARTCRPGASVAGAPGAVEDYLALPQGRQLALPAGRAEAGRRRSDHAASRSRPPSRCWRGWWTGWRSWSAEPIAHTTLIR